MAGSNDGCRQRWVQAAGDGDQMSSVYGIGERTPVSLSGAETLLPIGEFQLEDQPNTNNAALPTLEPS